MYESFLGCCHVEYADAFAVGYARPIIGNIPAISEMQARYVCGILAGKFELPPHYKECHARERARLMSRFKNINTLGVFPVEMFPYCDQLAALMGLPIGRRWLDSPSEWCRVRLAPATTMHYFYDDPQVADFVRESRIYMPMTLVLLILIIKPFDWFYRCSQRLLGRT